MAAGYVRNYNLLNMAIQAEQYDGRNPLPNMVRKDIVDSLGYGRRAYGINTNRGFVEVKPKDWVVNLAPNITIVLTTVELEQLATPAVLPAELATAHTP